MTRQKKPRGEHIEGGEARTCIYPSSLLDRAQVLADKRGVTLASIMRDACARGVTAIEAEVMS